MVRDGTEVDMPIEDVVTGDTVLVRPGRKCRSTASSSRASLLLTNRLSRANPCPSTNDQGPGDWRKRQYHGALSFRATKVGRDTVLAQIVQMVERAQNSKPPIGRLVDTIASYFVPSVMILAVLTFLAWFNFGPEPVLNYAIVTMIAVLVIACPCALGLATPISLMVGVGKAAEHGVLIRNGEALETASRLNTIVLDKTGTITKGRPELTDVLALEGFTEEDMLHLAAVADRQSEHPLAEAIVKGALARGIEVEVPDASGHAWLRGRSHHRGAARASWQP